MKFTVRYNIFIFKLLYSDGEYIFRIFLYWLFQIDEPMRKTLFLNIFKYTSKNIEPDDSDECAYSCLYIVAVRCYDTTTTFGFTHLVKKKYNEWKSF